MVSIDIEYPDATPKHADVGKTAPGVVDNYLRPLAESGVAVLAIDPRGTGETAPPGNTENSYRSFTGDNESGFMYDSLSVGATPLGMRARDVQRGVEYLRSRAGIDAKRISLIGQGSAGLPVLHVAELDQTVRGVAITGTLATYSDVLDHEIYTHRYVMFTPGVLRKYELPDVAALVAPRPLVVINAVDQAQRPLDAGRAAEVFAPAGKIFDIAGERFVCATWLALGAERIKYMATKQKPPNQPNQTGAR